MSAPGMLQGMHHICLKAAGRSRWEAAVAFYTQVLGCPLVRSWGEGSGSGATIDLGGCLLELMADGSPDEGPGPLRHIAFRTEDADGALELARSAGCEVTMEPADKLLGGLPIRIAFCRGPAGEHIEFFQER